MDKGKDNNEIYKIRTKYNLLIILTTIVWFLILLLHIYKIVDKISFRNGSVIAILMITALISTALIEMYTKRKIV